jgi:hypothetical protein
MEEELGWGREVYTVKQSQPKCGLLIIISILVMQGIPKKLSSLEGNNLVPRRWLLLPQGAASSLHVIVLIQEVVCTRRFYPFFSFGVFLVPCYKDVPVILVHLIMQERKETQSKDNRCKMEARMSSFFPSLSEFMDPTKKSVPFSKAVSKYLL